MLKMTNEQRVIRMQELLTLQLTPTSLSITDDSEQHLGHAGAKDGAGHFSVEISSPLFQKKARIECHKMIYRCLGRMMPQDIHALHIKIKT